MIVRTPFDRIQEKKIAEEVVSKDKELVIRGQNCGVVEFLPVDFIESKLNLRYDSSLIYLTSFFQELYWKGRYTEESSKKMQAVIERLCCSTQGKNLHGLVEVLRSQKAVFDDLALTN